MLQNKINNCRILISEVNENKATEANNQEKAKNNNTFFDAYLSSFLNAAKSYIIIKKYHKDFNLSDDLNVLYTSCVDNTLNIFSDKHVTSPIRYKRSVEDLNKKFQESWVDYIKHISDDLKDNLNIIRLVYPDKSEISKILVAMNKAESWPVNEETLQVYNLAKDKAELILNNMNYDSEIQLFLKKVRDKEATLYDLTDSVRKWLVEEGLEKNITIGIK